MTICTFFHWVIFQLQNINGIIKCLRILVSLKFVSDVTNYDSFDTLFKQIDDIVKDEGLNVLLNNAGISPKSTRLNFAKGGDIMHTFETNACAPVILTKV